MAKRRQWRAAGVGLAVLAGFILGAGGCGPRSNRRQISGTVTLDGQPVDRGNIEFAPISAEQPSASGAMVIAGKYTIPPRSGLAPGKYTVRIYWPVPLPADQSPNAPRVVPRERVPAKYNVRSELTVEVRPGQPNTFNFDLRGGG